MVSAIAFGVEESASAFFPLIVRMNKVSANFSSHVFRATTIPFLSLALITKDIEPIAVFICTLEASMPENTTALLLSTLFPTVIILLSY